MNNDYNNNDYNNNGNKEVSFENPVLLAQYLAELTKQNVEYIVYNDGALDIFKKTVLITGY